MNEPSNDPPLVLRVEPLLVESSRAARLPRPGFWEALLWSAIFLATQLCTLIATACIVFVGYAFLADNTERFFNDQLDGAGKAFNTKAAENRPPVPTEFANSLAWGILMAQFAALGLIALVLPRLIGRDLNRQLGFRRPAALHVLLVILLIPGFILTADGFQTAFSWITGIKPEPMTGVLQGVFGAFPLPLILLAISIGPGVVEEIWCRGFLGRGLCARYGLIAGVLITSFLFALMHLNPVSMLVYIAMGAYLHFVYFATRSIWLPVLLHAANNGVAVMLEMNLSADQLQNFPPIVVYIAAFGLLIFATAALWTGRATLQPISIREPETLWQPEYPGISSPPQDVNAAVSYRDASPMAILLTLISFVTVIALSIYFMS